MGHRSEELRAAGIPYQSYVEQAEVTLLQALLSPPVTVVLVPTAGYGNNAVIRGVLRRILAVWGEHSLMHTLMSVLCGCKSCSARGWGGRGSFALHGCQVERYVIFSHIRAAAGRSNRVTGDLLQLADGCRGPVCRSSRGSVCFGHDHVSASYLAVLAQVLAHKSRELQRQKTSLKATSIGSAFARRPHTFP